MTLTGTSVSDGSNMDTTVTLTSTGNISGVTFTVTGTDASGAAQTEDITGPNNNTVTGSKKFLTVTQIAAVQQLLQILLQVLPLLQVRKVLYLQAPLELEACMESVVQLLVL